MGMSISHGTRLPPAEFPPRPMSFSLDSRLAVAAGDTHFQASRRLYRFETHTFRTPVVLSSMHSGQQKRLSTSGSRGGQASTEVVGSRGGQASTEVVEPVPAGLAARAPGHDHWCKRHTLSRLPSRRHPCAPGSRRDCPLHAAVGDRYLLRLLSEFLRDCGGARLGMGTRVSRGGFPTADVPVGVR